MRYPQAIWRPTPKMGYMVNAAFGFDNTHLQQGMVFHSMEGSLAGAFGELDNPSRQASWTFSVAKDGTVYQHVDTANIAWTNGSYDANKRFWGVENEGRAGEPLTEPQYQALLSLVRWIYPAHRLPFIRQQTAWEHNEMTRFGSAPTACPSGRIPWGRLLSDFGLEADMTPEESARLQRLEEGQARIEQALYGNLLEATPNGVLEWRNAIQLLREIRDKVNAQSVSVSGDVDDLVDELARRLSNG